MKNIFKYSLLAFFIISCNSSTTLIEEYMTNEYKKIKNNKTIILNKKLSKLKALEIFCGSIYKIKNRNTGSIYYNPIVSKKLRESFINIKEDDKWNSKLFKKKSDTMFYYYNEKYANYIKKYGLKYNQDIYVYSFSDMINYTDSIKFFRAVKAEKNKHIYDKVIVFKRKKEKWLKVEEIDNTALY